MDIIILSILSTLTVSPLVIQQQVKALYYLGSSADSDSEGHIGPISMMIISVIFMPVPLFIVFGGIIEYNGELSPLPAIIVMFEMAVISVFILAYIFLLVIIKACLVISCSISRVGFWEIATNSS